jgi:uncharacterized protein
MPATRVSYEQERRPVYEPPDLREDGEATVSGYAALYNTETVIFGLWRERIAPGAFESALDGTDDVRALFNHDPSILLGRTRSKTLTLSEDAKGLKYHIQLPDTQHARDVRELIRRGDVSGSSFGFRIEDDEWDDTPTKKGKLPLVTIRKVELFDVSPVTFPAYPQTSVSARSKGEAMQQEIAAFQRRMVETSVRDRLALRIRLELAKTWQ